MDDVNNLKLLGNPEFEIMVAMAHDGGRRYQNIADEMTGRGYRNKLGNPLTVGDVSGFLIKNGYRRKAPRMDTGADVNSADFELFCLARTVNKCAALSPQHKAKIINILVNA